MEDTIKNATFADLWNAAEEYTPQDEQVYIENPNFLYIKEDDKLFSYENNLYDFDEEEYDSLYTDTLIGKQIIVKSKKLTHNYTRR